MTRAEWISVLAQARSEVVTRLAASLEASGRAEILRPPAAGLLLATVEESVRRAAFHPGEILVTTCEVRLDGRVGHGVVLGADPDKARACALLDAALQAHHTACGPILEALRAERAHLAVERHAEQARVHATRVRFETMDPQRV